MELAAWYTSGAWNLEAADRFFENFGFIDLGERKSKVNVIVGSGLSPPPF